MKRTTKKIMARPNISSPTRIKRTNKRCINDTKRTLHKSPTVIPNNNINHITNKITNNNRSFGKVLPLLKGETVYLIGGGPSLETFNWDTLKTKKVIAINKSFKYVPWATAIYWTDARFYTWYKKEIDELTCHKYTISHGAPYNEKVNVIKKGKRHGLEKDPRLIAHGDNSGYAAINLAYHMGAKKIILLGYDMGMSGTKSHFHDGYPVKPTRKEIYMQRFIVSFPHIANDLKAEGIKIYNTSKVSPLECFPKITIEESLKLC